MRIQCSHCGAQGNIDETKIPPQGANIKCPHCKNIFFVKKEESLPAFPLSFENAASPEGNEVAPDSFRDKDEEANRFAREGMEFLKTKMFDEALDSFQKVVTLNPQHPDGYRNLGVIYGQKKMGLEALKALENALEINPTDLQSYKNLGILYLQQKNFEAASSVLEKALSLNPDDEKIQSYLDLALKGRKSQPEPITSSPDLISPSSQEKQERRSVETDLLEEQTQITEITTLERAREEIVEEAPRSDDQKPIKYGLPPQPSGVKSTNREKVNLLLDQACDFMDSQKPRDAILKCKEALTLESNNPSVHFLMGLIYETRQQWEQAANAYEKTLLCDPRDGDARRNLELIKKGQQKKPFWKFWRRK
jgi:predicted Zn finger-like uncharacterized protein